jgi:phosphoglycerol transferase MdoB-like AlkP superfamily enzyme
MAFCFPSVFCADETGQRAAWVRRTEFTNPRVRPLWIQRFCIFFPTLALVLYLFYRDPKLMVIIGGYAQAVTLPIISGAALYLRYFRTDRRLAPSKLSDLGLWVAAILISAVAIYSVVTDVRKLLTPKPPEKSAVLERRNTGIAYDLSPDQSHS